MTGSYNTAAGSVAAESQNMTGSYNTAAGAVKLLIRKAKVKQKVRLFLVLSLLKARI